MIATTIPAWAKFGLTSRTPFGLAGVEPVSGNRGQPLVEPLDPHFIMGTDQPHEEALRVERSMTPGGRSRWTNATNVSRSRRRPIKLEAFSQQLVRFQADDTLATSSEYMSGHVRSPVETVIFLTTTKGLYRTPILC